MATDRPYRGTAEVYEEGRTGVALEQPEQVDADHDQGQRLQP